MTSTPLSIVRTKALLYCPSEHFITRVPLESPSQSPVTQLAKYDEQRADCSRTRSGTISHGLDCGEQQVLQIKLAVAARKFLGFIESVKNFSAFLQWSFKPRGEPRTHIQRYLVNRYRSSSSMGDALSDISLSANLVTGDRDSFAYSIIPLSPKKRRSPVHLRCNICTQ